jgi:hypothetical protein
MSCPSLDEAKRPPFKDNFWNLGVLTHPTERWAADPGSIEGIQAFLQQRSCREELRRIGREAQQMVLQALNMESKLDGLLALSSSGKSSLIFIWGYTCFLMTSLNLKIIILKMAEKS